MIVGGISDPLSGQAPFISNFDIGKTAIKPNLQRLLWWRNLVSGIERNQSRWKLVGFTDCEGSKEANEKLRKERAEAVFRILPPTVQSQITAREGAPIDECVTENNNPTDRLHNRSVLFLFDHYTASFAEEGEDIEVPETKFVCGPDVTGELATVLRKVRSKFASWTSTRKTEACDALIGLTTGKHAWDIIELRSPDHAWIIKEFNPPCASRGAEPRCEASVQVDDDCHYAGSVNYVLFGTMCRLCFDYLRSIGSSDATNFRRDRMLGLIWLYKGPKPIPFFGGGANFDASKNWAGAGHDGWPGGADSPSGDRSNCKPICPKKNNKQFRYNWYPTEYS